MARKGAQSYHLEPNERASGAPLDQLRPGRRHHGHHEERASHEGLGRGPGGHPGPGGRHPARGGEPPSARRLRSADAGRRRPAAMSAPEWIAALGDRDPSVPIALAAITRAAGADRHAWISATWCMSYREAHLACHQPLNGPDAGRDHRRRSAAPPQRFGAAPARHRGLDPRHRPAATGRPVRPAGALVGTRRPRQRQTVYDALLEAARRAAQRRQAGHSQRAKSASVLEGMDLAKSFKGRRVVDDVTVRVQQGEIVGSAGTQRRGKDHDLLPYYGADPARRRAACGWTGVDLTRRADVPAGARRASATWRRSPRSSAR